MLDRLIEVRNKITHAQAYYYTEISRFRRKPRKQRAKDHPLHNLTLEVCRSFYRAVKEIDRKFFNQYDRGHIEDYRKKKGHNKRPAGRN
jgi:hypothetical protein